MEAEKEGFEENVSNRGCNQKPRAGTTYALEVKREALQVRFPLRLQDEGRDNVRPEEAEREDHVSDQGCNYKTRAKTTYTLEGEREDDGSDSSCDYKRG